MIAQHRHQQRQRHANEAGLTLAPAMVVVAEPLVGPSDWQLQALTRALRTPRGELYGLGDA